MYQGVRFSGRPWNPVARLIRILLQSRLKDNRPTLHIRRPGSDAEEIQTFYDDDAFHGELTAFVDVAMRNKISREGKAIDDISAQKWPQSEGDDSILSSYDDGEWHH